MKTKRTTILSLVLAALLIAGTTTAFAMSAQADSDLSIENKDLMLNDQNAVDSSDSTIGSYVNPQDGKTYYSFDGGKTFEPLTDEEFEQRFSTPHVEWWTYDEYKSSESFNFDFTKLFSENPKSDDVESNKKCIPEDVQKYLRIKEKTISDTISFESDYCEAIKNSRIICSPRRKK